MGLKRKGAQDASFSLSAIGLLVGKDEVDHCGFILANRDFFLPDSWIREDGPLNSALGQYIEYSLLPQNFPTFVPGHDLIARQLKATPRTQAVPIIALTGAGLPHERVSAMRAGCERHLAKPCVPEELLRAIQLCITSAS